MPIGPFVRRLFGPYEHRVAALYRSIFIDLDDYAREIARCVPRAAHILEVGCGEGAVTEKLATLFPEASITAIDITPRVGRLYGGRHDSVEFRTETVQAHARAHPGQYDLILLSDVMHHVPLGLRAEILHAVGLALAPGGSFIFKEWGRAASPIHWLAHAADRWLTGDDVRYLTREEASVLARGSLPAARIAATGQVRPWKNNFMLVMKA